MPPWVSAVTDFGPLRFPNALQMECTCAIVSSSSNRRLTPTDSNRLQPTGDDSAAGAEKPVLVVEPYVPENPGPYPQDQPRRNSVKFTPVQVEAIRSGVQPGLTMVVGPPGTGER
jgi:hypothetical protein